MNKDWQIDLCSRGPTAATFLPPAIVEETAWDILLALHSDHHCELSLAKLGSMVSVSQPALNQWLSALENQQLITAARPGFTHELRAALTPVGRELLNRYFSATIDLQVGTRC